METSIRDQIDNYQHEVMLRSSKSGVIDLTMINPDIPPPRYCLDKLAEQVIKPQLHRYAVARGVGRLRSAVAEKYSSVFGVRLDSESEVCITAGSKDGLLCTLRVLAREGERILLPQPTYPAFISSAEHLGLTYGHYQLDHDWRVMLVNIRQALDSAKYSVIVTSFPNNPTGISVTAEFFEGLADLAEKYDIQIINDFVWGELSFDSSATSLLTLDSARERACELYSLSKAYSVPGWRVGVLAGPSWVVSRVAKLKQQVDYGISLPVQYAAASVLSNMEGLTLPIRDEYRRRYTLFSHGLKSQGWLVKEGAVGGFLWALAPKALLEKSGDEPCSLVRYILEKTGVAALPACSFDSSDSGYVRFALVKPIDELQTAIDRIKSL